MATDFRQTRVAELQDGDDMSQPEFHAIYCRMPEDFHAELIAGRVYLASPMKYEHGVNTTPIAGLIALYETNTPGVSSSAGATVILGNDDEPEPDLMLRVLAENGGRTVINADGYCQGPPEFLIEISDSTRAVDLGVKRQQYAANGVLEYLMCDLKERRLRWFDLRADRELSPDSDGIYRIRAFPGLWVHSGPLFDRHLQAMFATLNAGLASPEHAAFVAKLAAAKKS